MSIKSQRAAIMKAMRKTVRTEIPRRIERSLTTIGVVVANKSNEYAPLHLNNLIPSQDRTLERRERGYTMQIIYTAGYAAALHERTDWTPRPVGERGKVGGGWNPNATPKFLSRAGEESLSTIRSIIRGEMRL